MASNVVPSAAKQFSAALIGASGNVGNEILRTLLDDRRVGQILLIGRREIASVKNDPRVKCVSPELASS